MDNPIFLCKFATLNEKNTIFTTMRVLIVNTSERTGGAAIAANRLKDALNNSGVKTMMLVTDKETDDITVAALPHKWLLQWHFLWERWCLFLHLHFKRRHLFEVDMANCGSDITGMKEFQEADVIHLHWVNQGMLSLKSIAKILQSGKPVVWTMHDMWPATGICHLTLGCTHYQDSCGNCAFLPGDSKNDLSAKVFKKKLKILSNAKSQIHFVAVSTWLKGLADQSLLTGRFPVDVIPNVIDLNRFQLLETQDCRSRLLIKAPHVLAFGAYKIDAPIKGFNYLIQALKILLQSGKYTKKDIHLIVFGGMYNEKTLKEIPVEYSYMGYVQEDSLSQIYSASDAVVSSSLYETFGQTLVEAMACGCLPVSFDNSGQTDIIDHLENGYLAKYKSPESLAEGLDWAFHAEKDRKQIHLAAVKKFSSQSIAARYIKIYNSLTKTEA